MERSYRSDHGEIKRRAFKGGMTPRPGRVLTNVDEETM
jgi:hypothetical protein